METWVESNSYLRGRLKLEPREIRFSIDEWRLWVEERERWGKEDCGCTLGCTIYANEHCFELVLARAFDPVQLERM